MTQNCRQLGIAVLGLVLSALAGAPAQADEACHLTQFASVATTDLPSGQILVPVMLDGKPLHLVLDTAAENTILFSDVVERLHLTAKPVGTAFHARDLQGSAINQFLKAGTISFDKREMQSPEVLVMPRGAGQDASQDGVFGADLLNQSDLEIDPAEHRINIFSQDHCPGKVVYWTNAYVDMPIELRRGTNVYVQATLDGHDISTALNTGATGAFMSLPAAKTLFGLTVDSPSVIHDAAAPTEFGRYRTQFDLLSLSGIAIRKPVVYLIPDNVTEALNKEDFAKPDGTSNRLALPRLTLGMNELHKLRIYIAYGEHRLYVTGATAH